MPHDAILEARGHLVDSQILPRILDRVIACGAEFEVLAFELGRTNDEPSRLRLAVRAPSVEVLERALGQLVELGCTEADLTDARLEPAEADRVVPDDFYSTTNHRTFVRLAGRWTEVARQRMDAVVAVADGRAECRKLRDVKRGELVVCGHHGVRTEPPAAERDRLGFAFMASEISSERRVASAVAKVAELMRAARTAGGRIVFVAGPVVVHTGGVEPLARLVRAGWLSALLGGNAIAVHDVELALFGTSLGVDLARGGPVEGGHRNHMRAINAVNRCGSLAAAVEQGVLRTGLMHELVRARVPFVLAGSIRDDGPLSDTEMDLVRAQEAYARELAGARLVVCLASMLHSIGVGNMLPSSVRMVCVDINPAVVTKLCDRGSQQTVGIVTDAGTFLGLLARELAA
jgi:lysine-ketoglutarate reductase/saccharopine dehydrogenase-like protein (TIGR00300 family)